MMWNNAGRFVSDGNAPVITHAIIALQTTDMMDQNEDDFSPDLLDESANVTPILPPQLLKITRSVVVNCVHLCWCLYLFACVWFAWTSRCLLFVRSHFFSVCSMHLHALCMQLLTSQQIQPGAPKIGVVNLRTRCRRHDRHNNLHTRSRSRATYTKYKFYGMRTSRK